MLTIVLGEKENKGAPERKPERAPPEKEEPREERRTRVEASCWEGPFGWVRSPEDQREVTW